ncbi:hypothetical protein M2651_05600 [Clostridium sp. SYSU_GA19001]|uniref:hypothetical protein n=1 Tax=Clostridium caldaquaticum TaxID=2940653 RepID=UPI0020773232|nr:hypothetical protein [Clostridium caldaquaticum]MCM8710499.1 hypothetical protein [Clostridium caldaquaticum]
MENTEKILMQILGHLEQIKSDVETLKSNQTDTNQRLSNIETKLNSVYNQTAKTCEDITLLNQKFDDLKDDIDFLTHKENQTEKEVYSIKKKLQIVK